MSNHNLEQNGSNIIQKFKEEGLDSYRSIVNFYEHHEEAIAILEFDSFLSVYIEYVEALYQIGAHHKFLNQVERLIQISVERNIVFFEGKDIFEYFLYKKAAALLNLGLLDQCERVVIELLKMKPNNFHYRNLLEKVFYKRKTVSRINMRMYAVSILLFAALLVLVELVFSTMGTFAWNDYIEMARNLFFIVGLTFLVSTELASFVFSKIAVNQVLKGIRNI